MSCNIVRLCGITSRFQLLSPSTRQVTHALLTRPPLSHKELQTEVIRSKCFVRLACVKHAASVHPEPLLTSCQFVNWKFQRIFRVVLLFSYQCSFINTGLKAVVDLFYSVTAVGCFCCPRSRRLDYNITNGTGCQHYFSSFLLFFWKFLLFHQEFQCLCGFAAFLFF